MTTLDIAISVFVNSFAHRWWTLDVFVHFLEWSPLLKGSVVLAVFFYAWFPSEQATTESDLTNRRQVLSYTLLICLPGLIAARLLSLALPFRFRPLANAHLQLHQPFASDQTGLGTWSSFPSEQAVLFFVLAAGMYIVDRKIGLFLYLYTIFCISLPMIFLGIHYPSDIFGGALLGVGLAYSVKWSALRRFMIRPVLRLQEASPGLFYSCFFFLAYQAADTYEPLRGGIRLAVDLLHAWMGLQK